MIETKHWASHLKKGERILATIRHKTDGSKNLINIECIVLNNDVNSFKLEVNAELGNKIYTVPYNEVRRKPGQPRKDNPKVRVTFRLASDIVSEIRKRSNQAKYIESLVIKDVTNQYGNNA